MANELILPRDLVPRPSPVASEVVPSDNGDTVGKVTLEALVNAGRPLANQTEAEAGVQATKAMTPLTTKQAIEAQGDVRFASAAQGALADSATQPGDLATVATTGAYADLSGKPTLGTAAAQNSTAFATAAQGAKADTAVQSVVAGTNVTVNNADPRNPIVSASGSAGSVPHLSGLTTAPGVFYTYGFQVAAGQCSPINGNIPMVIATAIEKGFNFGWAPGNNQGGYDGAAANVSAALVASTTYYMFVIAKADGSDPDCLTSTSPTAPTMPTGYTLRRRIGWMKTDASAIPRPWRQDGGWFKMLTGFEIAAGTVSTTSTAQNVLLDGPVGIKTIADFAAYFTANSSPAFGCICDPDVGPATIFDSVILAPLTPGYLGQVQVWTDSLGKVSVASNNAATFRAFIRGFYDMRDTFV